jgi:hypothetical protein
MSTINSYGKVNNSPPIINNNGIISYSPSPKSVYPDNPEDSVDLNSSQKESEVSFLFYLNGQYKDIGPFISSSAFDIEKAGSNDDVKTIMCLGKIPYETNIADNSNKTANPNEDWTGVRILEVPYKTDDDFNLMNLKDLKKAEREIPANPFLNYVIGKKYFNLGDTVNGIKYHNRALRLGFKYTMKDLNSEESKKIFKEYEEHTDFNKKDYESTVIQDLGPDAKMCDPAQLEHFIELALEKYPSKKHVLVVHSHGTAWGGVTGMKIKEFLESIKNGVKKANEKTGRNDTIDVIVLDVCELSNIEALTQAQDAGEYFIASENVLKQGEVKDRDINIKNTQYHIRNGESFEPEKFGCEIFELYNQRDKLNKKITLHNYTLFDNWIPSQLSLIKKVKINSVGDSWKNFLEICDKNGITDRQFFNCVKESTNFSDPNAPHFSDNIRDMGSIMDNFIKSSDIPESVKESAKQVKEAIDQAVIRKLNYYPQMKNCGGITIWAPTNLVDYIVSKRSYVEEAPDFAIRTGWFARLEKARANVPQEIKDEYNRFTGNLVQVQEKLSDPNITEENKKTMQKELDALMQQMDEFRKKMDFTN